jgi:hypothetical protein
MNSAIETNATQENNYQKLWPCTPRLPKTDLANLPEIFLEYVSRLGVFDNTEEGTWNI